MTLALVIIETIFRVPPQGHSSGSTSKTLRNSRPQLTLCLFAASVRFRNPQDEPQRPRKRITRVKGDTLYSTVPSLGTVTAACPTISLRQITPS
jgi:hypothetical protein